jgi:hypothetical protein
MKPKKNYHKDANIEKNMIASDLKLLKSDREEKVEKKVGKLSIREKFLNSL